MRTEGSQESGLLQIFDSLSRTMAIDIYFLSENEVFNVQIQFSFPFVTTK
jgi:hypothetical protein